MVAGRNAHAYQMNAQEVEAVRSQQRRQQLYVIKKQQQKEQVIHRDKVILAGTVVVLFVIALCFTAMEAKISSCGYTVNQLKEEIELVQAQNERLELEIENSRSLADIEAYATANLDMIYPGAEDVEYIEYSGIVAAQEAVGMENTDAQDGVTTASANEQQAAAAATTAETTDTGGESDGFLNSVGAFFNNFFSKQAAAAETIQ